MSQPTPPTEGSDPPARDEAWSEPNSFTLVVVSPSAGVPGPLTFPNLPVATTVKELKAKIRDVLPAKPADESQRLIHRGRMLGAGTESMLDIFGLENLKILETQTLHLVLRPAEGASANSSSSTPTPTVQPSAIHPIAPLFQHPRPASTPAVPVQGISGQQPPPGFPQLPQHQVLHQYEHLQNVMNQRLHHLQRETQRLHQEIGNMEQLRHRAATQSQPGHPPHNGIFIPPHPMSTPYIPMGIRAPQAIPPSVQVLINQQQRERAAEGRYGAQDSGNVTPQGGPTRPTSSGRASPSLQRPEHTTTYSREGVGPNGERWHVTVNETTTTHSLPHAHPHPNPQHNHHPHPNPALDVQAVLRNADRFLAAQTLRNDMQRIASNASQAGTDSSSTGQPPNVPWSTTADHTSAPAPANNLGPRSTLFNNIPINPIAPVAGPSAQLAAANLAASATNEPMVYILSSSQGPRALLVHNSGTFYTPRQRRYQTPVPNGITQPAPDGQARGLPQPWDNRIGQRAARRAHRNRHENNPLHPVDAAHANPGAGALAAQIAPYLWLIIRLIGFVWFFSMGSASWSRILTLGGLAFLVFLYNTGMFNGVADGFWGPVRRHLEALIPLAGPDIAPVPDANGVARPEQPGADPAGNEGRPRRRRGELDPAEVAAHLLEHRRRANGGWLMVQIRRAEHALLLFLASLVPGVGERHIAAREAEEAERQRRIEAAAAAENPEAADTEATTGEIGLGQTARENEQEGESPHAQRQEGQAQVQPAIHV